MQSSRFIYVISSLYIHVLCVVRGQPLSPGQEQNLRDFVSATIDCRNNVGLSLGMVRNGMTVFADGFGLRDNDNGLPMLPSTRISIASLTKSFTSSLCAHAVSRGLVTWDIPLQSVLGPDFGMEGPFRTDQLCLRDALAHKIGVPTYWGVSTAAMNVTKQELCMERLKFFPTLYDFRSRKLYSNYPYVLAGYVQEVVTNQTWDDYLTETLLVPLEMNTTRTASQLTPSDWTETAYSYILQDDEYIVNPEQEQLPFLEEIAPAAGILSTAEDMAEWLKFQIRAGQTESGEVIIPFDDITETQVAQFSNGREYPKIQKPSFPVDDMLLTTGFGWNQGMYRGFEKISHSGSYSSYNCIMTILQEMEMGVWVCVNSPGDYRGSYAVEAVSIYALDLLLDEEPWLNTTTTCTYPDPWDSADIDETPNHALTHDTTGPTQFNSEYSYADEEYVGDYHHPAFGYYHIIQNGTDGGLHYEFGLLLSGDLNPSGTPDMYHMTLNPPISYRMIFFPSFPDGFPVYFHRDPGNGTVVSVDVPYLEFDLPPIFIKE